MDDQESSRNAEHDLAICETATKGPLELIRYTGWKEEHGGFPAQIVSQNGETVYAGPASFYALKGEGNARLLTIAQEALSYWIRLAQKLKDQVHPDNAITWLYSHCQAIGMAESLGTGKSLSGTMRDDIALFTIKLKARAEEAEERVRKLEALVVRAEEILELAHERL